MHAAGTPPLHWTTVPFAALSAAQLYQVLQLRSEIFVVEQACAYLDPDGKDPAPGVLHLCGRSGDGELLAYCRLLPAGLAFALPSIGRVVVAPAARGRGLAHRLMEQALAQCAQGWPGSALMLGAQQHLAGFYAAHGFAAVSETYLEDGIPHIDMHRPAAS